MFRLILTLLFLGCVCGCAALSKEVGGEKAVNSPPESLAPARSPAHVSHRARQPSAARKVGLVFGKTDFKGLLKAAYVRLTIVNREQKDRAYYHYFGQKDNHSIFPWGRNVSVEPGYFYLQIPPGKYEISAVAIPAGTNIAEESMSLSMEVAADKVNYLGTLEVDGVKENTKFGGVPLVRPGFLYTVAVKDEFDQAQSEFEKMLPKHDAPIGKKLLIIN